MTIIHSDIWESTVRNYELDYQGIVNNANYFHYFDNARAILLDKIGLNVTQLATQNINLVLIKTEVFFKKALKDQDIFCVTTDFSRISKFKLGFSQIIFSKKEENIIYAQSESIVASINSAGKPAILEKVECLTCQ